jgi:hypothetical protein
MLVLFDLPKNVIHAFNTYGTLYNHLESFERNRGKGKEKMKAGIKISIYGTTRKNSHTDISQKNPS